MTNDPYEILGVDRDATKDEINAAYRKKSKDTHPDSGGDTDSFMRVKSAAMVLLDPKKRKRFDEDGVIDDNKPDNKHSNAMEKVAAFFVNSINATVDHPVNLDSLDLVQGANAFFDQQISACNNQINNVHRQVAQFEKALKRLKTKKEKDVLKNMLTSHMNTLRRVITANEDEIAVFKLSKEILNDYEFEVVDEEPPQFKAHNFPFKPFQTGRW